MTTNQFSSAKQTFSVDAPEQQSGSHTATQFTNSSARPTNKNPLAGQLMKLASSVGVRHGFLLSTAMIAAGALDYVVNVLVGRWLSPVDYGVFVSVAAILQVFLYLSIAIRNVVAFYGAELSVEADRLKVAAFVQSTWRWAWRWGIATTGILVLLSGPLGRLLRFSNAWPLWAAAPMVLALFLRPVTDGILQGTQAFGRLGLVHVSQAFVRLIYTAGLIWLGSQAVGAIFALPLACFTALALACFWLRPQFHNPGQIVARSVSWHYSSYTLLGFAAFGTLVNLDALFVKRFFSPVVAGNYGSVVTVAKVCLFFPMSMGMVLLPKAKLRQAAGRNARPILILALAGVLIPGLILTTICLIFPGPLVRTIFGPAYTTPGLVLGLASWAAVLYAGLNIWLNYALSLERPIFIYVLVGVLFLQALCMYGFCQTSLLYMTVVMVLGGLLANLLGFLTTWWIVPGVKVVHTRTAASSVS
jgi:O-antigen/teichoic acid export membrane protein